MRSADAILDCEAFFGPGGLINAILTRHLHALAVDIGCRPSGSLANQAAADYVRDAFRSLGLAAEEQP